MALNRSEVEKIAHLARINLKEDEIESTTDALNSILELINSTSSIDTTNISPLANPLENTQRLRNDVITEHNHREYYQESAPEIKDGLYLVPKVID